MKTMLWLRSLVECRTRRGSWAYILWSLAYLPPMVWTAGGLSFHVRPYQLLPLLIPIVVVLVQLAYPTLLGWAVIVMPSVFFAGGGVVSVILTAPVRIQHHEPAALVTSSVAAAVYVLVCVALWFARPKRPDAAAVQPTPAVYEQE